MVKPIRLGGIGTGLGILTLGGLTAAGAWGHVLPPPGVWNTPWEESVPVLNCPPSRIVSGTLATDEILLALLPPQRLAALTYLADDPTVSNVAAEARAVPGRLKQVEAERVLALEPDLLLVARYTRREIIVQLEGAGVPVLRMPSYDTLSDIRRNICFLGSAVGVEAKSEVLIAEMDQTLAHIRTLTRGELRPRVLYYGPSGFTAGKGTIFSELLEVAGGRNAVEKVGVTGYVHLPLETALALDPEVILLSGYRGTRRAEEIKPSQELADDPAWKNVAAVRNSRVYTIPGNHLSCISHHVVKAAEDIARVLHPDRFPEDGS